MIEVFFLLLSAALVFLAWRLISCLQSVSLSGFRAQDRERRDMFHLFERLIEKRNTSPSREHIVLPLHSGERMQETASCSEMEKEAVKENGSPPLVSTEPGEEMNMFEALHQ
jgi:hypothetical protein